MDYFSGVQVPTVSGSISVGGVDINFGGGGTTYPRPTTQQQPAGGLFGGGGGLLPLILIGAVIWAVTR